MSTTSNNATQTLTKRNTSENFTQSMWQNFVIELNKGLGNPGLSYKTYIPTSGQSAADWELLNTTGTIPGTPGTIIVNNLESWCNNMPVWGPSYIPGNSLYDNYSLFLYSLKLGTPGDPAQQQIANAWAKKVQSSQQKINQLNLDSAKAWSAFNAAQENKTAKVSYAYWYQENTEGPNKPNGPSWAKSIEIEVAVKENALIQYQATLKKVGGVGFDELSDAIKALKLTTNAGNVLIDNAGALWPKYTVSPGLNDWFLKALATDENTPEISFEIDLSTLEFNTTNKSEFLSTDEEQPFLSSTSGSKITDHSALIKNMKMTYKAQSAKLFTISAGTWFDTSFMSNFSSKNASGVYLVSPDSALHNKELFGQDGFINLRTVKLLAVFKSSISLEGSDVEVSNLKQVINTTGKLSIAGMSIDTESISQTSTTNVTMASNSNTPNVIGIVSEKLG